MDSKNRDRHLLAPSPAVGYVQVAVVVEDRVIDLMQSSGKRRCEVNEWCRPNESIDAHRHGAPFETRRDEDR